MLFLSFRLGFFLLFPTALLNRILFQPTVEAFFLVHAAVTSSEEKKKPNQKETRKEQHSHIEKKEG